MVGADEQKWLRKGLELSSSPYVHLQVELCTFELQRGSIPLLNTDIEPPGNLGLYVNGVPLQPGVDVYGNAIRGGVLRSLTLAHLDKSVDQEQLVKLAMDANEKGWEVQIGRNADEDNFVCDTLILADEDKVSLQTLLRRGVKARQASKVFDVRGKRLPCEELTLCTEHIAKGLLTSLYLQGQDIDNEELFKKLLRTAFENGKSLKKGWEGLQFGDNWLVFDDIKINGVNVTDEWMAEKLPEVVCCFLGHPNICVYS